MRNRALTAIVVIGLGGVMMALSSVQTVEAEDYETPQYVVLGERTGYEVRRYPEVILASITVEGDIVGSMSKAFRPLAKYIGGENGREKEISMTAPVIAVPVEAQDESAQSRQDFDGSEFVVSFIMPSSFESAASLPQPRNERVRIHVMQDTTVAAVRFSGFGSSTKMVTRLEELKKRVADDGYQIVGSPIFAKYDPPWRLPWKRRNEVLIPISADNWINSPNVTAPSD